MAYTRKFYVADTHFGHASIIRSCARPFASVGEMDAEIVRRWNETVSEDDIVYHLGDWGWPTGDPLAFRRHFHALNGRKVLVLGNHDVRKDHPPSGPISRNCRGTGGPSTCLRSAMKGSGSSSATMVCGSGLPATTGRGISTATAMGGCRRRGGPATSAWTARMSISARGPSGNSRRGSWPQNREPPHDQDQPATHAVPQTACR